VARLTNNDTLPFVTISSFNEIWKGRESFSDKEARMEAIESLKKMIRSWLDDTFPDMPEAKRQELSEAMDVTLIEQQKVESMKTFFEINNVIRMSFIEMQYMKKVWSTISSLFCSDVKPRLVVSEKRLTFRLSKSQELLNALDAIDEMMSANDMTTNVAAITPVAMLAYILVSCHKFMFYALLKLGKSREETYSSFRSVLTDLERLLVMRDDPPYPPVSLNHRRNRQTQENQTLSSNNPPVLGADDLGMLMLHVHELRSILWQDNRRFSSDTARSVLEDLAELAGERGVFIVRGKAKQHVTAARR